MEAFSFCCPVYWVGECFGSYRPLRKIWWVFSIIFKNTLPLCWRTVYYCPEMAFVVVQGGVYHRLLSPVASNFRVKIGTLQFLRLHVSYCLLRTYVSFIGGKVVLFGQSLEKFFYHPFRWIHIHTCDVERVGKVVRRYLPRHCLVRGCWGTSNNSCLFYVQSCGIACENSHTSHIHAAGSVAFVHQLAWCWMLLSTRER